MDVILVLGVFLLTSAQKGFSQLPSAPDGFQNSDVSVGYVEQTIDTTGTERSESTWNTRSKGFSPRKLINGIEKLNLDDKPMLMSPEINTISKHIVDKLQKNHSKALDLTHKGAYIETAGIQNLKVADIIGINSNETVLDLNMANSLDTFLSKSTAGDKYTREKIDKKLYTQTDIDGSTDSVNADINRNDNNSLVTYQGKRDYNGERKHDLLEKTVKSMGNIVNKHGKHKMSIENIVGVPKQSHISNEGLLNSKIIKTISGSVRTYGGSTDSSTGTLNDSTIDLNNNTVPESLKLSISMYEVKDAGISIEKANSKSSFNTLDNNVQDLINRLDTPFLTDVRQENNKSKITQKNKGKSVDEATLSVYDKTDGFEKIKMKQPDSSSEVNADENLHGFTKTVQNGLIGASPSENLSPVLKVGTPEGTIRQKDVNWSSEELSAKSLEGNKDERKNSDTLLNISILKDKQFVRQPQTMSELIRLFGIDAKLVQNLFIKNVKNAKNVSDISSSGNRDGLGIIEDKHSPSESDRSAMQGEYHTDKKQVSSGNEKHLLNNLNSEPLNKLDTEMNNSPDGFSNVPAFISRVPYLAKVNKGTTGTMSTAHDKPEKQSSENVNVVVRIRGLNANPTHVVSDGLLLDGKTDIQTPKYAHINVRKTGHNPSKRSKQLYESTDGFIHHDSLDSNTVLPVKGGVDSFIDDGYLDIYTVNPEHSRNFTHPRKQTSYENRHHYTIGSENIVQRHASSDSNVVSDRGQYSEVTVRRNRLPTTPGAELHAASSIERNFYSSGSLNGLGRYPVVHKPRSHTRIDSDGRRRSTDVVLRQSASGVDFSRLNALHSDSFRGETGSGFRNSISHGSFRGALPPQRGDAMTRGGSSRPDILHRSGAHVPFRRGFSDSGPIFRRDFSRVSGPRFRGRTYPLRFRTGTLPRDGTRFTGMYSASPSLYRTRPHRLPPSGFTGRRFPMIGVPPRVRPFTPAMTPLPFRFF